MPPTQSLTDPQYLRKQYQDASNLNARIRLHREFSTNPYSWQRWLFDHFTFSPGCRVLELGCGPGTLWVENADRIPPDATFLLSDLSEGMVAQAQGALESLFPNFEFQAIDAQEIPISDERFDVVIASHMLYHVPNMEKALSEIRRVLKPGGRLYASTAGRNNLKENRELVTRFDPQLASQIGLSPDSFTLDNGAAQLGTFFATVTQHNYPNALEVTDAQVLTAYLLSGRIHMEGKKKAEFARFVQQALADHCGTFHVTIEGGVFEAVKF
ncbi:MAG: class I SAM-dependent methyltransferase [Anaerolineaceae bacterium]|nr:class I SAM-dependent methyltransferase [Anaerolineaceae bacterium]